MQERLRDNHQADIYQNKGFGPISKHEGLKIYTDGFQLQKGVKLLGQTITFSLLNYEFSIPMPFLERGKTQKTKQLVQGHIEFRFEQNMFESKTVVSRYLLP